MEVVELDIDESEVNRFADHLKEVAEGCREAAQAAMAEAYYDIVYNNIGFGWGEDRPVAWAPLSPQYAKQVNRSHATLFLNGQLLNAIKVNTTWATHSTVSISDDDCPYAVAHQYGYPPKRLPSRPYFPFDPQTGEHTAYSQNKVAEAAARVVAEELRRS